MVSTAIFKKPVNGPVAVGRYNLEGDAQADLKNHGGEHMAVYAYSLDHYDYWRAILDREEMPYGQFGENLTVDGLDESVSCVGDRLRIGSSLFTITQPRVPCFKLGIRLGDDRMPRLFSESGRTGFYLKVEREGVVQAGDAVELVERGKGEVTIRSLFEAYMKPGERSSADVFARALDVPQLAPRWRGNLEQRLRR